MQNARFNLYSTKVPRLTTPFGEAARCSVTASASKPITTIHTSPPPPFTSRIIIITPYKDNPALISVSIKFNLSKNSIFIVGFIKKGDRL